MLCLSGFELYSRWVPLFNNCGKSLNNYSFRYGADELENVKSYKYLGLIMSPYHGNFNLARQELKNVALKALYKLRKEIGNHFRENIKIKLTMKLFDALISPMRVKYGGLIAIRDNKKRIQQN